MTIEILIDIWFEKSKRAINIEKNKFHINFYQSNILIKIVKIVINIC